MLMTREFLEKAKFRMMDDYEKQAFAGCESPVPLIAELDTENRFIIIDGIRAQLFDLDEAAEPIEFCDDITQLPE